MPTLATFPADVLLGPDFPLPLDEPFTLQQALDRGVSVKMLRRLHARGFVRRLLKGVYVAAQAPDGLMLRARALALVVPKDSVVVDWTAVSRLDDAALVNGIAQIAPFDPAAKQTLLEADNLSERSERIIQLMQIIGRMERDGGGTMQ